MGEAARITGCEIFAAGTHRGKLYTLRDLDDMVANFRDFSSGPRPLLRVPAVLGHEESQEWLDRSDLPAAAWAEALYRDGDTLEADLGDIPPKVARLLKGKAYRTVSAEVYDAPPEGVPGDRPEILRWLKRRGINIEQALAEAREWAPREHERQETERQRQIEAGADESQVRRVDPIDTLIDQRLRSHLGKMLRRVAFLGGEIPQIKRLEDIPDVEGYAEDGPAPDVVVTLQNTTAYPVPRQGSWAVFSEIHRHCDECRGTCAAHSEGDMNRDEMLQALGDLGYDTASFEGLADDVLAEILRGAEGLSNQANEVEEDGITAEEPAPEEMDDMPPDAAGGVELPPEEMEDDTPLVVGDDPDNPEAMSDDGDEDDEPTEDMAEDGGPVDPDPEKMAARARKFYSHARKYYGKARKMMSRYCGGDDMDRVDTTNNADGDDQVNIMTKAPEKMSEKTITNVVRREVERAIGQFDAGKAISRLQKFMEEETANRKKAAVDSFVEAKVREGKILPREKDLVAKRLYRANSSTPVETFTEKGKKVSLTEFDLQVREIEAREPFRFGERVKTGGAPDAEDEEAAKVASHFDMHREQFEKFGETKEGLVNAFKLERKAKKGNLTADEFIHAA
jgi:hypothetical protein